MDDFRLSVKSLTKNYPGVRALDAVDLGISPGEVHAVVGENGAGKSTLIRIVAGVETADEGTISVDGSPVRLRSASEARKCGLAFIHQELNLVEYFTAAGNLFLGHRIPTRWGVADHRELCRRSEAIFASLDVSIDPTVPVRYLSPGERAMVAVARAFADEASIYFMDEPATALSGAEKQSLFAVIRRLRGEGRSIVYVTHNLDDVLELCDRVTVLRDGRHIETIAREKATKAGLIRAMVGESIDRTPSVPDRSVGAVRLSVRALRGSGVGPVDLEVRAGEIVGVGGLVGAGRSTLLHMLAGGRRVDEGEMTIDGRSYRPRTPAAAVERGVVLIPEERRAQGLLHGLSVRSNATISSLKRFSRAGLLDYPAGRNAVLSAGRETRLKISSVNQIIGTLSGGNQQKVLFARAFLARPSVLLLDEPSKGVDVAARFEIYDIIRRMAGEGVAVLVVSSDFDEMLNLCDRFLFLREGRQGVRAANDRLDRNDYLQLCYRGREGEQAWS